MSTAKASVDPDVMDEMMRNEMLESSVVCGFLAPEEYNEFNRYITETEKKQLEVLAVRNAFIRRDKITKQFGSLLFDSRERLSQMKIADQIAALNLLQNRISKTDLLHLTNDFEDLSAIDDCVEAGIIEKEDRTAQFRIYIPLTRLSVPESSDTHLKQLISGIELAREGLCWGFIKNREEYLDLLRQAAQTSA